MMSSKKILDIGCGRNKLKGAIGVDLLNFEGVDVVWDLNKFPYPFPDDEFDEIYCNHVLEHLDNVVATMKELYRIGKNKCKIFIRVPHASCSFTTWSDPTHRRAFTSGSFNYFDSSCPLSYYAGINIKTKKILLHYCLYGGRVNNKRVTKIPLFLANFIDLLANLNRTTQLIFERFLANFIGGFEEIYFELEIIK